MYVVCKAIVQHEPSQPAAMQCNIPSVERKNFIQWDDYAVMYNHVAYAVVVDVVDVDVAVDFENNSFLL